MATYPTKADAELFKSNADLVNEIATSDEIKTILTDENGKTKYTISGITQAFGGIYAGDYVDGTVISELYEYALLTSDGTKWKVANSANLPYEIDATTYPDPADDPNLILFTDVSELKAVAIANNTTVDDVAELKVGATYTGQHLFYSATTGLVYEIIAGLTGTATAVSADVDGVITVTIATVDYDVTNKTDVSDNATDTGAVNAIIMNYDSGINPVVYNGMRASLQAYSANTGTVTISYNDVVYSLTDVRGAALVSGDYDNAIPVKIRYDSALGNFVLDDPMMYFQVNQVKLGLNAGKLLQGSNGTAVGRYAAYTGQGESGVAVGDQAGHTSQGEDGISIGRAAGYGNQGDHAFAAGALAGLTSQPANSIVISGDTVEATPASVGDILFKTTTQEISATSAGLKYNGSLISQGISFNNYANFQDQKTSGTAGGASVSGVQVRTLNSTVENSITGCSLTSNQITLAAGDYYVRAKSPLYYSGRSRSYLYDTTGASILVLGAGSTAGSIGTSSGEVSSAEGKFTLSVESVLELRTYVNSARTVDGLGRYVGDGELEIYATIEMWGL